MSIQYRNVSNERLSPSYSTSVERIFIGRMLTSERLLVEMFMCKNADWASAYGPGCFMGIPFLAGLLL